MAKVLENDMTQSLEGYMEKWRRVVTDRQDKTFFESLKPVALGWKVTSKTAYDKLYAELHDDCDRIVETWMNERWIAKMHLKSHSLPGGISIVKLMQTRPGSGDPAGLDHADFYSPKVTGAEDVLKTEKGLDWSWESNDVIDSYDWISLWFAGTEAKLKADTVLDIVGRELQELNDRIKD